MRQSIQLTILFLSICSFSFSQTTIVTGKVVDNKSKPFRGASITVKDTYDGATTDSTGNFRFKTTVKGDHIIVISSIGFKPYSQNLKLDGADLNIEISLKEEMNEMQAVVISATSMLII